MIINVNPLRPEKDGIRRAAMAKIHIKYNVKEEALTEELARIQREFLNKKEKSKEDYDRRYWFQKLSNDLKIGISKEDIEEYRRIFYSHLRDEITFSEHTGDVLKNIKDSGKKLAILTEADPALPGFKQERLNKFPFYPLFDLSIIAGETIPEHKTQPEAFVKVTELLHMNPENVAFVGDSPEIDVKNAKEAGKKSGQAKFISAKSIMPICLGLIIKL